MATSRNRGPLWSKLNLDSAGFRHSALHLLPSTFNVGLYVSKLIWLFSSRSDFVYYLLLPLSAAGFFVFFRTPPCCTPGFNVGPVGGEAFVLLDARTIQLPHNIEPRGKRGKGKSYQSKLSFDHSCRVPSRDYQGPEQMPNRFGHWRALIAD